MNRRTLGPGQENAARVGATDADLHDVIPGDRFLALDELRERGVFSPHPTPAPSRRRTLGAGARATSGTDGTD
ncbi:hypothetical protein J7E93_07415 [Streptomyces sp. ISL-36]|uniref:hypothetical protein n=1 Tax=Streptomyces sp. ISL-36 TaxID=2819182 RepID=UPI001BE7DD9E|nr:hypothetical protein [Streptomyces sp. ISL-36]MBT2439951.1 hypothetical protein [Streptomyces sp. ISL-36]